jgi:ubiquinone/menaquinone biosynthesis C-methylase UbiE
MDYDKMEMADVYDAGRGYSPAVLQHWLLTTARYIEPQKVERILDLGCGTGRYSSALADHFSADVDAIDPSEKMLQQARRKQHARVRYHKAAGERIPLPDDCVDLVFMSMVFHHFREPNAVARECHRVLKRDGIVCLRAGTRERVPTYPIVRFFPASVPILERTLDGEQFIKGVFAGAGLRCLEHELVQGAAADNWLEYSEKISYRADSVLAQLSDDEFSAGLENLRGYAQERNEDGPVVELIDFFVFCH